MKTFLPLLLMGILSATATRAQDSISFKVQLSPQRLYTQAYNQRFEMHMDFDSSSQEILDKLKENGAPPTERITNSHLGSTMTTGIRDNNGLLPVVMRITDGDSSVRSMVGLTAFGKAPKDGLPVYDSIAGSDSDTAQRATFMKTINSMSVAIPLPNARMVPGGSYTQVVPLKLPIGPMSMGIDETLVYTLREVTGDIAHFTVVVKISMGVSSQTLPFPIVGGGDGSGTMTYDIRQHYFLETKLDYEMRFRMSYQGMVMHIRLKAGVDVNGKISPAPDGGTL